MRTTAKVNPRKLPQRWSVTTLTRHWRQRPPPAATDTGFTLVGDDLLPATGTPSMPLAETLHLEGLAPTHQMARQVTAWLFLPDQEPRDVPLETLTEHLQNERAFVWVNLSGYTEADLQLVSEQLALPRAVQYAMRSPWHRPSLAVYNEHLFLSATVAHLNASAFRVYASEMDLCLGHNYLVTAHKLPLPFRDRIHARMRQAPDLVRLDAAYLLYIVLDELLAYYEELNRHVTVESEELEERALHDASDSFLTDLLRFKRYVFAINQLADQHREVFAAFFRPDFHWISGQDIELYFRDLQSRLAQLLTLLQSAREAVTGAFNIYVSQMSHRTNQIIKILTMVSTLLLPATLIIALFGTNVQGILPSYRLLWFVIMLVSMGVISIAILLVFARQQWIRMHPRR